MSTDSSENIANNNRVNTPSSDTENADQSQNDTDGVVAAVQVYAGRYAESSIYEGIPMEQMPDYYTLNISTVTETTFDLLVMVQRRYVMEEMATCSLHSRTTTGLIRMSQILKFRGWQSWQEKSW